MTFTSNTALYADPDLAEGVDWARRFRRHELFDDSLARTNEVAHTAIIAPHGGGIEPGTSELCLAVAGYHPAMLPETPPGRGHHDYWMFEGLRPADNDKLHVTSTGCDDPVALSLCGGSLHALSLHGFEPDPGTTGWCSSGAPRRRTLRLALRDALEQAGFKAVATGNWTGSSMATSTATSSTAPCSRRGVQLELSLPLRGRCSASSPGRAASTPPTRCSGPSWRCAAT